MKFSLVSSEKKTFDRKAPSDCSFVISSPLPFQLHYLLNKNRKKTFLDQIIEVCRQSVHENGGFLLSSDNSCFSQDVIQTSKYISNWLTNALPSVIKTYQAVFKTANNPIINNNSSLSTCHDLDISEFLSGFSFSDRSAKPSLVDEGAKAVVMLGLWSCVSDTCRTKIIGSLHTVPTPFVTQRSGPITDTLLWRWIICLAKCVEATLHQSGKAISDSTNSPHLKVICQTCMIEGILNNTMAVFCMLGINPSEMFSVELHCKDMARLPDPKVDFIHFLATCYSCFAFSYTMQPKMKTYIQSLFSPTRTLNDSLVVLMSDIAFHSIGMVDFFLHNFKVLHARGYKHLCQKEQENNKQHQALINDTKCLKPKLIILKSNLADIALFNVETSSELNKVLKEISCKLGKEATDLKEQLCIGVLTLFVHRLLEASDSQYTHMTEFDGVVVHSMKECLHGIDKSKIIGSVSEIVSRLKAYVIQHIGENSAVLMMSQLIEDAKSQASAGINLSFSDKYMKLCKTNNKHSMQRKKPQSKAQSQQDTNACSSKSGPPKKRKRTDKKTMPTLTYSPSRILNRKQNINNEKSKPNIPNQKPY